MPSKRLPLLLIGAFVIAISAFVTLTTQTQENRYPSPSLPTFEPYTLFDDAANYSVVYMVSDTLDDSDLHSPRNLMGEVTQARIAHTWEDVLRYDAERPIEALIVHPTGYEFADYEWTAAAARRGITIAVINMYYPESGMLAGSLCDQQKTGILPQGFDHPEARYFLTLTFMVQAEDPRDQANAEAMAYNECREPSGEYGEVYTYSHGSQGWVMQDNDIYSFMNVIIVHVHNLREARQTQLNRQMGIPPTAPPPLENPES